MVSGFTQVVAVIGHPITQVKSPENFNRYFADQQIDSVMIPVDIAPEAVADFLQALRGWHNMSGVLVTVPHKQRAAALVDELTPRAQHLNAINVIRKLADGRLQGDMLDGVGFQLAAEAHGFSAAGKKGCSPAAAASAALSRGGFAKQAFVNWRFMTRIPPCSNCCITGWQRIFRTFTLPICPLRSTTWICW